MKKITLVAFCLILNFLATAQNKPQQLNDLENSYTDYFRLNRETVFLHLNKTSVIKNEDLWLSAYVYNNTLDIPNSETMNLNLEIFSESGEFLESQTLLIAGGKGSTFVNLKKNLYPEGNYFIKASTKYMENFKEELSYVQTFEILGSKSKNISTNIKDYDLQILPEGGHLLANVRNNVGVKLINANGESVIFSEGKLLDADNTVISSFTSNQFGLSKFNFSPELQQEYRIEVTTFNGETLTASLPKSDQKGFNIIANDVKDQFIISINTNSNSQDLVEDKTFYIAIHQDGNIKDFAIQFPEDKLEVNLKLNKDSLFAGINTITIFDENFNPLLERLMFNEKNIDRVRVNAQRNGKISDSVSIGIKASVPIANNSLSISVLPSATKSYNPKHNILSAIYLKPYLNGDLVNGGYYFSNNNARKLAYDLDLLLLTQGWSKFKWQNIFNNTPKELIAAERGFTINGEFNGRTNKKENVIFIKSAETGLFEIVDVASDNSFELKNIYILDSTALSYGLMNEKNSKISKPSIYASISPNKTYSRLKFKYKYLGSKMNIEQERNFENFIVDAEILDTVNLKGYNKKLEIPISELRFNDKYLEVTDEVAQRYLYVTDYIAQNGFSVYYDDFNQFFIKNKLPFSLNGSLPTPLIYFNGFPNGTPRQLEYLYMEDLESIVINKLGVGYGMRGGGGVIKIQTRNKPRGQLFRETVRDIITNNGFTANKEFYAPKYISYTNESFTDYGVIDWISDISLEDNGSANFKILNTMQPQVNLYIEGMTVDGKLISEVLKVPIR